MSKCNGGLHFLRVISSRSSSEAPDAQEVVRWCAACGAVVIDLDIDGRTAPGAIFKMAFPQATKTLYGGLKA
ncbi:hypothetical protein [Rhodoferax aquaticus]|uniref:Uncharacterized protein n=1 Tax=Rhodoferax aquaticus TaxID=2527691 RepID=A0A515ETK2_9BURK|nr:hypothetical protein [Rhodoferax aquaticus]QDL55903.1 hypothetical protein EXZ61_17935 [Rhodoferax aquaticus]